ncbi:MAG: metallophosphoesterase, partial [Candidatus Babeliales bacterium]
MKLLDKKLFFSIFCLFFSLNIFGMKRTFENLQSTEDLQSKLGFQFESQSDSEIKAKKVHSDAKGHKGPKRKHAGKIDSDLPKKNSKPITHDSFLFRFSNEILENYKEFSSKANRTSDSQPNCIIPQDVFAQELNKFINLHAAQNSIFLTKDKWGSNNAPDPRLLNDLNPELNFRHPYAQKLDSEKDSHIVVFGDIHGSIHSLIRNLWRLFRKGFLDENLKITDPKGYIVFLGDLVDRGRYGIEVLFLSMFLKNNNFDKVFILRGNHEDPKMGIGGGLYTIRDEVKLKYPKLSEDIIRNLISRLNCFYDLLPSALFIGCNKNYTVFSHAGIDPSYNPVNLLSNSNVIYECLKDKKENSPFLDNSTRDRAVTHFNDRESMSVGEKTNFYCFGFNWFDFGRYKNHKGEIIDSPDKITFSGHGYNISLQAFEKYKTYLNETLLSGCGVKIQALVRGHQHTSYGLLMFDPRIRVEDGQACDWKNVVDLKDIQSEIGFYMHKYFPIYTLLSAPEGVGKDNTHGIQITFNKDFFSIITTSDEWGKWLIKPFEFDITGRSDTGIFCEISQGNTDDSVICKYLQEPSKNPVQVFHAQRSFGLNYNVDREVERIFSEFKYKFEIQKQKPYDHDVKLEENPLKYPISADIKTQSLNHIRSFIKKDVLIKDLIDEADLLPLLSRGNAQSKKIMENALAHEIAHSRDYYVFYHAHTGKLALLHDMLKKLYSWGHLNASQPLSLRFINDGEFAKNLSTFLDQSNVIVKNASGFYDFFNKDKTPGQTPWFDHIPNIGAQLLSANLAFFGNKNYRGESTFDYFCSSHSERELPIPDLLKDIFIKLGIPEYFLDRIEKVIKSYNSQCANTGKLLQIFVKKDAVDDVAYLAFAGGKPVNQKLFDVCWDESKKRHTKISTLLDMYLNNPTGLQELLARNPVIHDGVSHHYNLDIDNLQARLWLPASAMYDPEKIKILRYGTDQNYAKYASELNDIFEEIIKSLIKQKLTGQTAIYQHLSTPMKKLDTEVSAHQIATVQSETMDLMQDLEHLDLATIRTLPNEYRFLCLAKEIYEKREISEENKKSLKSIIPLFKILPDGSTPLIFAIKTNNITLVKFLLENPCIRKGIFQPDHSGKTALDWCSGNQEFCETILRSINLSEIDFKSVDLGKSAYETITKSACAIIEKNSAPEILRWAMDLAEKLILKDSSLASRLAKKILEKNSSSETLAWVMRLVEKLVELSPTQASVLTQTIIEKDSNPETLTWAICIAEKLYIYSYYNPTKDLLEEILEKSSSPEILSKAMDHAVTLAERFAEFDPHLHDAFCLAQTIIVKNPNPNILAKIMGITEKVAAKNSTDAAVLVRFIVANNSSSEVLTWAMNLAAKLIKNDTGDVFMLAKTLVEKNSSPEILLWAMDIAENFIMHPSNPYDSNPYYSGACNLVNSIIEKNSSPKILSRAMDTVEKFLAKKDPNSAYGLANLIIEKNSSPEISSWAMGIAEKIIEFMPDVAYALAIIIMERNSSPEILSKAMDTAEKFLAKKDPSSAYGLAKLIIEKSSSPEMMLSRVMNITEKIAILHTGSYALATLIIEKNSSPEILSWAMGLAEKLFKNGPDEASRLAQAILDKSSGQEEILFRAMGIAKKLVKNDLLEYNVARNAIGLAKTVITQSSAQKEILDGAMGIVEKLFVHYPGLSKDLISTIIAQSADSPEILSRAMNLAEKFIENDPYEAIHLAMIIVEKNTTPKILSWAMNIIEKITEKFILIFITGDSKINGYSLTKMILEKNASPEMLSRVMAITEKIAKLPTESSSLATLIIEKNSSPEILSWAMGIAEKLIEKNSYDDSIIILAKTIVTKSSGQKEILSWAMAITEKIIAKNLCDGSTIDLIKTIVTKSSAQKEILPWAMNIIEKIMAITEKIAILPTGSSSLATLII